MERSLDASTLLIWVTKSYRPSTCGRKVLDRVTVMYPAASFELDGWKKEAYGVKYRVVTASSPEPWRGL